MRPEAANENSRRLHSHVPHSSLWQAIAKNMEPCALHSNFQNLVHELAIRIQLVERSCEELYLQRWSLKGVQTGWQKRRMCSF